ncbi:MAG: hypothetical protein M1817_003417 [Caeruleum heppii]|nr:MAG: hypothetical protein M1817_003417 [Caeruleum heppii]
MATIPTVNQTKTVGDAARLLQLVDLISASAKTVINEWAEGGEVTVGEDGNSSLMSHEYYEAQRTILAAAGMLTEVVGHPQKRLLELSCQFFEARALQIVAEHRIPDMLAKSENRHMSAGAISAAIGIEPRKLSRLLRCLCSNHIFKEVQPDVYTNNAVSVALVDNEPIRAYILMYGMDLYSASDYLPKYLVDPVKGPSYDGAVTPWQDAFGTEKLRWEWLEEMVPAGPHQMERKGYPRGEDIKELLSNGHTNERNEETRKAGDVQGKDLEKRPEHEIFGLAMLGGGKIFGTAHLYDYPWASLGKANVVDVGGGVGGFSLQLSRIYPDLEFIVQDRAATLIHAEQKVWPAENPEALAEKRVAFMPHDFFKPNPVEGADVYWMRYIMHDWSDEDCIKILTGIRCSMRPQSRILIADAVMNTTLGCDEIASAPKPLPANYGFHTRYAHSRDLALMTIMNGLERTPAMWDDLIGRSGLALRKIWECRSLISILEVVLP